MQINFKAPTLELTEDVREYVEEKVEMVTKLLKEVDEENLRADVELSRKQKQNSGVIFRADITIYAGSERTHAVGHGESIQSAIDESKDELTRRLSRGKTRKLDSLRRGGAKIKNALRFWK